ncbi:EAL domain-containing protein [Acidithiobacillus sp. 'AMD consortium']|jgi:diguanylate cyclase (GGDEF)-like protein|uniref:EAL domain-containing protein n=1 Tax=Acidithiobacillus TaxID=119977 RepID=UPI00017F70F9|nr:MULTISPECIES: EAL domain-containing protein [Acidithiobacillus]ACH83637.1 diguanylate cyclase/phosphodiesterase [Acidithiobacillus ferrooxidans ATCC 53993]MBN6745237.1 EAL domain-containing protein [Acidithiobacillus sp. MC2.2]MBN6748095.1 EAL domain-containing protein [Acidithiobacillus sp. PG05]MBU2774380.1 EAL domain-containing protein [Acidithiobacillus ferrooxidans]MCR0970362.1 EAL domain-containing protein [Acidithiobacillus ferrooxidans]
MIIDNSGTLPAFLGLQDSDFQVIDRYRDALDKEASALAHAFYDYLLSHPATAAVFRDFSSARLDALIQKQTEHAKGLLVSRLDRPWRESMRKIGALHHHLGIGPSWIAGAYILYWRHWQKILQVQVPESDRDLLRDALFRLLVGDLMVQLEGYAHASRETDSERLALSNVLMSVLAAPRGKVSLRPEDLLQQICDDLPAKSGSVRLAGYMVSDVMGETLTLEHQAGLLSPGLQLQKSTGDPCWKALGSGQSIIQAVDDPQAPEWIKALRNQVEEIGIFPFGTEDLRGAGLIGVREKGYFQRVGSAYFNAFAHLGELVFLLRNQFLRDPLTALPNRFLFMDFLENARNQTLRHERLLGVAILDLDGFKQVNDRLGHGAGDQVLQAVVQRLQVQLRAGDILARLGGDEFGLILPDLERLDDLDGVSERLLAALREPLEIDGEAASVTGSLGITLFPLDDSDASTLIRHADMALYAAKDAGRDQFQLHSLALDEAMRTEAGTRALLEQALQENRLVLYYQPVVSSAGAVIGVEALIRLQHPERGLIPPAAFFSALDHVRLARPIGRFVLNVALHQAALWQEAGHPLRVSVNISTRHLLDARFLEDLQEMLAKYPGLRPELVEIEITESAPLRDMLEAQRLLVACHRLGVRVALDDFGTGNASLTYLQRLPADSIKIDQSFVRDVIDDPKDLAIVTAVITASRMLGMNVIAEGVETADHVDLLVKTGCNHLQGYFFSKPIPAEDVPAWVAHFRPAPRTKDSLHPLNILSPILEGHILRVQKFIGALRQENPFPAHVIEKDAEEYCHLGLWLRGEGKQRFGATPQFMRLLTRHERLHQVARVAKLHFDAGDADGAMEQGKLLDMENGLLLAELLAMAGESRDNI